MIEFVRHTTTFEFIPLVFFPLSQSLSLPLALKLPKATRYPDPMHESRKSRQGNSLNQAQPANAHRVQRGECRGDVRLALFCLTALGQVVNVLVAGRPGRDRATQEGVDVTA